MFARTYTAATLLSAVGGGGPTLLDPSLKQTCSEPPGSPHSKGQATEGSEPCEMPRADRMLRGRCGQQTGQRPPLTFAGERSRMVQSERVASRRAHALQHWLCRVSARPSGGPPHSLGEASTAAATRGFPERADACPRSRLKVAVPQSPPTQGQGSVFSRFSSPRSRSDFPGHRGTGPSVLAPLPAGVQPARASCLRKAPGNPQRRSSEQPRLPWAAVFFPRSRRCGRRGRPRAALTRSPSAAGAL